MFTETAYEAFMKLKQVRRRSWGGGYHVYIYIYICFYPYSTPVYAYGPYITPKFGKVTPFEQPRLLRPAELTFLKSVGKVMLPGQTEEKVEHTKGFRV